MSLLLGIDVGTTGTKTLLIDDKGNVISEAYQGYPIISETTGFIEQDAQDWWNAVKSTIHQCIKEVDDISQICAISLSTQGGSMVPVDKQGKPLCRAAIWMDQRGHAQTKELLNGRGEDFYYGKTGWRLSNSLNLVQIKWLKDNNKEIYNKTFKFLSTADFINYKLTGTYAIDPSNAGMTQLFDIVEKKWSPEIILELELDNENLSKIVESSEVIGELSEEASLELGLSKNVKVISGGHDQYCVALGAGVFEEGSVMLSTGTAWVLLGVSHKPIFDTNTYFAPGNHVIKYIWGLLSTVPTAGICLEWFKNNLGLSEFDSFSEIDTEVENIEAGAEGVLFYPHFCGTSYPEQSFNNKATILGLQLSHNRYHIGRAMMEGVIFDLNWRLQAFQEKGLKLFELKVLGGATKSRVWTQMIADITGIPVVISEIKNTACLGAAILAGVGSGVFENAKQGYDILAKQTIRILPDENQHAKYRNLFIKYTKGFELIKGFYDIEVPDND